MRQRLSGPPEVRFWQRVARGDGCWQWAASKNANGYGLATTGGGRHMLAHRFAWEYCMGPIPDGLHVCHTCDNPSCVNPDHLFLGTHQDNMRDRDSKGRNTRFNRAKTHCPQGHEYSTENTRISTNGRERACIICSRQAKHRYRARLRARAQELDPSSHPRHSHA